MHAWLSLTAGLRSCEICELRAVPGLSSALKFKMGCLAWRLSNININNFLR